MSNLGYNTFMHLPDIDFYCFSEEWLASRMLFLAGPRQVGKTTYSQNKIKKLGGSYFNWDSKKTREAYFTDSDFFVSLTKPKTLVVFDEIHKQNNWKNILKGAFDIHRDNYTFMITGSAKLDTFRHSGDSLVGRYFLTHLLPLSIGDLTNNNFKEYECAESLLENIVDTKPHFTEKELNDLINLSGFPEPFYKGSKTFHSRWQNQHEELLIGEDLRDLTNIVSFRNIEHLVSLLKERIAKPISFNSLAQILEVNHNSIKQWITQLEKIMLCFSIPSWSKKLSRSIKKNHKVYFYNWACIKDEGAKFENFIASQLYKACILWHDRFGQKFELYFIRNYDEQEVDFLITLNQKPWLLIEAKNGRPDTSSALYKYKDELNVPAVLLTNEKNWNQNKNGIKIISANKFLSLLP